MIGRNIELINGRITETALRCGRDPKQIRLVAVSKRFPTTAIVAAQNAGQQLFGENYIQEAQRKYEELQGSIHLHFIGHLQSNKAKIAAQIFQMVETVDSIKLANALNKHLIAINKHLEILVQVNIGDESSKSGVDPDHVSELLRGLGKLPMLKPLGLMTIPPYCEDAEKVRPYFRELRLLAQALSAQELFYDNDRVELSMGMSDDFHIAIEEGATLLRIGTMIFGQRSS